MNGIDFVTVRFCLGFTCLSGLPTHVTRVIFGHAVCPGP